MKKFMRGIFLVGLLLLAWFVDVFHSCTFPTPKIPAAKTSSRVEWAPKSVAGINQLVLEGAPYERGLLAGQKTHALMDREEMELISLLDRVFPGAILKKALSFVALQWFWGVDKYFEERTTLEMLGVSRSASPQFNYLGSPFVRQVAYHGIHEIGQMMIDQGGDDVGCTVVALPIGGRWILGRNFDFEGGRIFDSEKIMKWVFPDEGYAFISVIWAGMVGAVTGVNEHGLYVSINAAGSGDFRRVGTPSTLIVLKALQFAKTATDAVEIFKNSTMFITDIFVVSDRTTGEAFRIEKSPLHTEIIPIEKASVVTNHLIAPRWEHDRINSYRRSELTSLMRSTRGESLVADLAKKKFRNSREAVEGVLSVLRDKGSENGKPLNLGNRRAIDALIAAHSVVYDETRDILYVGQGPAVSGPFIGYDLAASFRDHAPRTVAGLARDAQVSDQAFENVKESSRLLASAQGALKKKDCPRAREFLGRAERLFSESAEFYSTLGDSLEFCQRDPKLAQAARRQALTLNPAYPRQIRALTEKLLHE